MTEFITIKGRVSSLFIILNAFLKFFSNLFSICVVYPYLCNDKDVIYVCFGRNKSQAVSEVAGRKVSIT